MKRILIRIIEKIKRDWEMMIIRYEYSCFGQISILEVKP